MDERSKQEAPIAIISLLGTETFTKKIELHLRRIYGGESIKMIETGFLRFATGDAKVILEETVRGRDIFIIADVGNYDCHYTMYDKKSYMSPDEHFQNLKRVISAIGGKAHRITVITPMMYAARQDRRIARESLDCAVALQELEKKGVKNIMAFDVHDVRVQNAVPFMGFDNLMPTYQVIKAMKQYYPDLAFDENNMIVVSPDVGAANRNFIYSGELELEMGLYYKRRSRKKLVDGKYPVEIHKYIGPVVEGKDVLICDDIIASGDTILDVVLDLKRQGAFRVFVSVTFALFTNGIDKFNKAYDQGLLEAAFITNATYRPEALLRAKWYREVDVTEYTAYYIYCVNTGKSISNILDPHEKIQKLLNQAK